MIVLPANAMTNAMEKAVPDNFSYNCPTYPNIIGKPADKPIPTMISPAKAGGYD